MRDSMRSAISAVGRRIGAAEALAKARRREAFGQIGGVRHEGPLSTVRWRAAGAAGRDQCWRVRRSGYRAVGGEVAERESAAALGNRRAPQLEPDRIGEGLARPCCDRRRDDEMLRPVDTPVEAQLSGWDLRPGGRLGDHGVELLVGQSRGQHQERRACRFAPGFGLEQWPGHQRQGRGAVADGTRAAWRGATAHP